MALSAQQRKFCEYLVAGSTQAEAYEKAGYKTKSEKASRSGASRMLTNGNILEYLNFLQEKATTDTIMSREEVLKELSRLGRANMANLVKWDKLGLTMKASEDLPDAIKATVSEITEVSTDNGTTLKIKQYCKVKSLELLAKHHGALDGYKSADDSGDKKAIKETVLDAIGKLKK